MRIKLICGFRRDQEYSVDAEEAHKAYYLFLNPEARGVFNDGLAIIGSQIQEIVPDYQGTMGWNPTHVLDSDDWNELREKGVDQKIKSMLTTGKDIAQLGESKDLNVPLSELVDRFKQLGGQPHKQISAGAKSIAEKMKIKDA